MVALEVTVPPPEPIELTTPETLAGLAVTDSVVTVLVSDTLTVHVPVWPRVSVTVQSAVPVRVSPLVLRPVAVKLVALELGELIDIPDPPLCHVHA